MITRPLSPVIGRDSFLTPFLLDLLSSLYYFF